MISAELETSCIGCIYSYMKEIFTEDDFQALNCNRSEMTYSAGDIILKQGAFVSQIIYLKQGMVKIVLEEKNNRKTILKITNKGNFIGLPILGNPDIYPFSVIALTDCSLCFIRKETITNVMERNPKANRFLLKSLTEDCLFKYNRISILSTRNNHGKLASAIYYLLNENFCENIFEKISRKELAQLAAISIESCNKILSELKNDKIIEIQQNRIKVIKPELIKKLSTAG